LDEAVSITGDDGITIVTVRRIFMARVTTLTSKGQVTIPKEIRDELGLKPHDKIRFAVENGHATLCKAYLSLDELAGILPPLGMDIDEAIELAKEVRAQELIEKMKRA
jgi:AbrB family looped-hinge helix DNA binding protein